MTYLKEEVQVEQLVRRLDPFRAFVDVAAQCNGQILNYNAIARNIGSVDHKTVQSYFQILEETHLGFLLKGYSRSVRKAQATHPKFYFFDTGVKRALANTLDVLLKPKTYPFGEAFEHWVILEIFRLNSILMSDYRLSYFRTRDAEIDMILSKPDREILIEIKSSEIVDPIRVRRFSAMQKAFDRSRAYWLSLDNTPQKIEGVDCLPWKEGLKEIFDFR